MERQKEVLGAENIKLREEVKGKIGVLKEGLERNEGEELRES